MLNRTSGGPPKGFALGQDQARAPDIPSHIIFTVPWGGQSGEGPSCHLGEVTMESARSWGSESSRRLAQLSCVCLSLGMFS